MKYLRSLLQDWITPLKRWTLLLVIVCWLVLLFFTFENQKSATVNLFRSSVQLWEGDFALALLNDDRLFVEKLSRSLITKNMSILQVFKENRVIYSYPEERDDKGCASPVVLPISRYSAPIGQVSICMSNTKRFLQKAYFLEPPYLLF